MQVKTFLPRYAPRALAEPDGSGRLAFAQRSGRDGGHDNVLAVGHVFQPVANRQVDFGFGLAVELQFVRKDAGFGGDNVDRNGSGGLGDIDVAGYTGQAVR